MILGSGPNRIGQGIEFDYCCVHAAMTVRESGRDAVMVNCNPETVSTDYDTSDRLYFEPLTLEDVLAIVEVEQPEGVIVSFGGQTPLRLAAGLEAAGVPLLGTQPEAIDLAEDRGRFGALLERLGLKAPPYALAQHRRRRRWRPPRASASRCSCGPSYVLGGRAMELAYDERDARRLPAAHQPQGEIFLDRFLENAIEVDVDAICDGEDVWIGGIMQHVEEAGIHSGDSACVLPPHSLGDEMLEEIREPTRDARARARRRRADQRPVRRLRRRPLRDRGQPARVAHGAVRLEGDRAAAGQARLPRDAGREAGGDGPARATGGDHVSVKEAVLPFDRFEGADALLGPEMRSTGEVMGVAADFPTAFAKAQAAAGARLPIGGTVFLTVTDSDKSAAVGHRRAAARPRLPDRRHARHGGRDQAHGHPGRDDEQDPGRLAARRRLDRQRRRRPRDQHADRHRRALGRLRDPPRGGRPRRPVHHDDRGRDGGGARDRRRAPRRAAGASRCRSCTRRGQAKTESHRRPCRRRRPSPGRLGGRAARTPP